MHVIHAPNPDSALASGVAYLTAVGEPRESRNGPTLVAPGPVTTVFTRPMSRVSHSALRDANPFFHLMEALWMLAGRNDVALPAHFAKNMSMFSDDGFTLNGAYGFRWRAHFKYDQLDEIVAGLRADPTSRREVLAMWDGGYETVETKQDFGMRSDLLKTRGDPGRQIAPSKDVPCNTHAYFSIVNGALDMTVCNRSNDIVWGAYGANVVHFSFLLEYMAGRLGVPVGRYFQVSNNYHAYITRPDTIRLFENGGLTIDTDPPLSTIMPLFDTTPVEGDELGRFDRAVQALVANHGLPPVESNGMRTPPLEPPQSSRFLQMVVVPMGIAHALHAAGLTETAIKILADSTIDWHVAGRAWLQRRLDKKLAVAEVR
jgi:Thymidylate synthase